MEYKQSSGNRIVDAIGKMDLTGNVIPEAWYLTIVKKNGKGCPLAVLILADIVYWYRPKVYRDEVTQAVTYSKKFYDNDFLQRNYAQIMDKFGISKKQAYEALVVLEELGVIQRHFRTITTSTGIKSSNVMYIELIPDVLMSLTYPDADPIDKNVNSSLPVGDDLYPNMSSPLDNNVNTYTGTTTEIATQTPTTAYSTTRQKRPTEVVDQTVVDQVRDVYADLGLSDADIMSIVKASGNNIDRCLQVKQLLDQQRQNIRNVPGWLIKALKDHYQVRPMARTRSGFHNFEQREYTTDYFNDLEQLLAET